MDNLTMKLRHKNTCKVYDWNGIEGLNKEDVRIIAVRTNAEVCPEDVYDFTRGESDLNGHTMYYVEEPLSDFEILENE